MAVGLEPSALVMMCFQLSFTAVQIVEDLVQKRRPRLCPSAACFADNPRQSSHVPVNIRLLDINDNAPTFATVYETYVCERTKPGQVGRPPVENQSF